MLGFGGKNCDGERGEGKGKRERRFLRAKQKDKIKGESEVEEKDWVRESMREIHVRKKSKKFW